ncbi:hypothetical protein KY312_04600 [Candidatus Woesearchaeota archaeon]|nr:hypothetical protein [Candidatus Woesearchaeota archaeon]
MRLFIYLSYAVGLVLTAFLVIPGLSMLSTMWFVFYLLAGIFTISSASKRKYYFLANVIISVIFFIVSFKLLVVFIGLASSIGFVLSIFSLGKKDAGIRKEEKIKEIISEVVAARKPKVEVYEQKEEKREYARKVEVEEKASRPIVKHTAIKKKSKPKKKKSKKRK